MQTTIEVEIWVCDRCGRAVHMSDGSVPHNWHDEVEGYDHVCHLCWLAMMQSVAGSPGDDAGEDSA